MVRTAALTIDAERHEAHLAGNYLDLTALEFKMLHALAKQPGRVFSREQLLEQVWGYGHYTGSNVVDTKIRSLRKKLGNYAAMIETVSGIGYRFKE